ncbi:antitoxin, partial [Thermococci archaeon]
DLLRERKGNIDILKHICGIFSEEEYEETKKKLKEIEEEFEKWGQSLIRT